MLQSCELSWFNKCVVYQNVNKSNVAAVNIFFSRQTFVSRRRNQEPNYTNTFQKARSFFKIKYISHIENELAFGVDVFNLIFLYEI